MFGDRHILITGGAAGLGAALGQVLGAQGARIGILDLQQAKIDEHVGALQHLGVQAAGEVADVRDAAAVQAAVARLEQALGPVHILINNAGITLIERFHSQQAAAATKLVDVNLNGAINCTAACLDSIVAHRGAIVALSSVLGFAPLLGRTAYCASKHGLHGFFDTLRLELRDTGVQVMLVCPSFIRTGIRQAYSAGDSQAAPIGEQASPESVATQIATGLRGGKRQLHIGRVSVLARWIMRLSPRLYEALMLRRAH